MRHLKIIPLSIYAAGLLLMTGCASDIPADPLVELPEDSPLWLTLSLGQTVDTSTPTTRDGGTDNTQPKKSWESHISSLVAILVDNQGTDKGTIKGIAKAKTITPDDANQTYTALVNMGLSTLYTREHEYALYIFANLSSDEYSNLVSSSTYNQAISAIGQRTVAMDFTAPGDATHNLDLKMASNPEDVEKIIVWLKKNDDGTNKEYPENDPYVVQTNPAGKTAEDGQQPATIILTPLHSRLDFLSHTSLTFQMTESYKDASDISQTHSEYAVEIKQAKICNAADSGYLLPQTGATGYTWKSPAVTSAKSSSEIDLSVGKEITLGYVGEN
ncbi:MAG: hypothetical protein K2H46_12235, partial [Muribaculaceae bacterium]|nr:hypothetical protein [Muribaculaceae bacterium]